MKDSSSEPFQNLETDTVSFSKKQIACVEITKLGQAVTTEDLREMAGYASNASVRTLLRRENCLSRNQQGLIIHNSLLCDTVSELTKVGRPIETVDQIHTFFDPTKKFEVSGEHLSDIVGVISNYHGIDSYPVCNPSIDFDGNFDHFDKCNFRLRISGGRIDVWMRKKKSGEGYGLDLDNYVDWRQVIESEITKVIGYSPPLATVRVDLQQDDFEQEYHGEYACRIINELFKLQIYSSFRPEVQKYIKHSEVVMYGSEAVQQIDIIQEVLSNSEQKIINMEHQQKLNYLLLHELKEMQYIRSGYLSELSQRLNDFSVEHMDLNSGLIDETKAMKNSVLKSLQDTQVRIGYTNLVLQDMDNEFRKEKKYDQEELLVSLHRVIDKLSKKEDKPGLLTRLWRMLF